MTKATKELTADEAMLMLHDRLKEQGDGMPAYSDMDEEERRAYHREAKRRERQREREARAKGRATASDANVRHALADAALMLLATNAKGAEVVRQSLLAAFPGMPGVLMTVEQRVKAGKLKPKLVDPARLAEVREEGRKAAAAQAEASRPAIAAVAAAPAPEKPAPVSTAMSAGASLEAARSAPPAPADEDDGFQVPLFLRRAHGEA